MGRSKERRDFIKRLAALDIEVIGSRIKSHEVWHLRNRHGITTKYATPVTGSDRRGILNRMADLKRFARRTQ